MDEAAPRICPAEHAGALDNRLRRWLQNPRKILNGLVRPGMVAVDFGCGPGFFTIEMARMAGPDGKVFGIDLQVKMLDKVRAKIAGSDLEKRIFLHQCPAGSIGIAGPVDFILAFYVLHELPDQGRFFAEVADSLQTNGRLLIVEPPFHVSARAFSGTLDLAKRIGLATVSGPKILFSKSALLARER